MILFILFVCIIALLFLVINFIFASHNPYQEKDSIFECGFHSFLDQNRKEFSSGIFSLGIAFMLFDLEIVLLFPFGVSAYINDIYGLITALMFTIIVTIGFVFELGKGALKIDSRQNIKENNINSINVTYLGYNTGTKSDSNKIAIVLNSSIFSSNFFKKFTKHFTIVNFVTGMFGIFIACLFKFTPLGTVILTFVGINTMEIYQYILGGFAGLMAKLGIKGFVEDIIERFLNYYIAYCADCDRPSRTPSPQAREYAGRKVVKVDAIEFSSKKPQVRCKELVPMPKEDKEKLLSDIKQKIEEKARKNFKIPEQAGAPQGPGDKIFDGRIENTNIKLSEEQEKKNIREQRIRYDNQVKEFTKHIKDINEGKEVFYPKEAKSLFKEYVKALGPLVDYLTKMEKKMEKK
jgi:NADH-ubiquinone oxidoreductase chain 3